MWTYCGQSRVPLRDLTAHDVRQALIKLAEARAGQTTASTHNVLVRAIRHAQVNDHVGRNVASFVKPPQGKTGRPSRAMNAVEAAALLAVAPRELRHTFRLGNVRVGCGCGRDRPAGRTRQLPDRLPGMGTPVPAADAVLACPLTFNSVNKFAHGHADNFAVGLLCEMAGYGVPVVVVPHCKPQLASHPAFGASLKTLRGMGVRVLFDPDAPYERRLPLWSEVVDALPVRAGAS